MLRRLALGTAVVLGLTGSGIQAGVEASYSITWREAFEGFGSFSGLVVSDDGTRFVTVSDKGHFATGTLVRKDGRIREIKLESEGQLRHPSGDPLTRYHRDAEGLTQGRDGGLYVSFEAYHRVWAYETIDAAPARLPVPEVFETLQNNSSLEALAAGPDGSLYTIPERSGALDRPFPVYRFRNGAWSTPFSVPRKPPYLIADAAFGPDGRFYVLERDFALLGFRSRIRSFVLTDEGLSDEETVVETPFGAFDNLEGMALWRDEDGRIRLRKPSSAKSRSST